MSRMPYVVAIVVGLALAGGRVAWAGGPSVLEVPVVVTDPSGTRCEEKALRSMLPKTVELQSVEGEEGESRLVMYLNGMLRLSQLHELAGKAGYALQDGAWELSGIMRVHLEKGGEEAMQAVVKAWRLPEFAVSWSRTAADGTGVIILDIRTPGVSAGDYDRMEEPLLSLAELRRVAEDSGNRIVDLSWGYDETEYDAYQNTRHAKDGMEYHRFWYCRPRYGAAAIAGGAVGGQIGPAAVSGGRGLSSRWVPWAFVAVAGALLSALYLWQRAHKARVPQAS